MEKEKRSQQRLKNSQVQIINGLLGTMYTLAILSFILGSLYIIQKELKINSFAYSSFRYSEVQMLMIKPLWNRHPAC
jgi:hypothetical protein